MRTTDSACACQSRHCSLLPVPRQALLHRAGFARRRQADAPISCTPPPLCRRSGPIASSGRHHPPNGTPEKSIEPCRFTVPPAFSPTKFLWRLRAPKTLTSFVLKIDASEPAGPVEYELAPYNGWTLRIIEARLLTKLHIAPLCS